MNEANAKIGEIFEQRYELLEILGAGGIGTVFKANQLDAGRLIALKILHRNFADDEEFTARFKREGQALSLLHHENIVTVYHLGLSAEDVPYLAMELIKGTSIRKYLNEHGPMPLSKVVSVALQVCSALNYMHGTGVIHRDLKPDNIVFVDGSEESQIKIIDFGLVKIDSAKDVQKLTSTGALIGSVAYMSPEQCRGLKVDARSDLYSLMICIYEMLTGKAPFTSDNPMEIMYKQVNSEPPQLAVAGPTRSLKLLNEFFTKGLQKDPDNRFQNATELAEALNLLNDTAIGAKQIGQQNRPSSQRTILFTATAIILLISSFTIYKFLNFSNEKNKAVQAVLPNGSPKEDLLKTLARKELTDTYKIQTLLIFFKQHGVEKNEDLIEETMSILQRMPLERKRALYPRALNAIGIACYEVGDFDTASKMFTDLVKITDAENIQKWNTDDIDRDAHWQSLGYLCAIYLREGKKEQALNAARIIAECPYAGDADALTVALTYKDEKLARAIIANQKSNGHLSSLSRVSRMFKRFDLAKKCLDMASGEMGDLKYNSYVLETCKYLQQTGQIEEAKNKAKPFGEDTPAMNDFLSNGKKSQFRYDAAILFEHLGEHKKAVSIINQSRFRTDQVQLLRAYLACEDGDLKAARSILDALPDRANEYRPLRRTARENLIVMEKAGGGKGSKLFDLNTLPY